ncbi:CPBP family intramembrane glutamic endopeptidase [Halalkalibaculum sp. DA3122]|uniref:CPBP family intramembrane glutamic endopeptidase n=1 Tax=Halalkalibaculum sp. DA3122 TaxID=3373607 RepID=UPI003755315A
MNIFYNFEEQRLRAGWRLLLQFLLMIFLLYAGQMLISYGTDQPGFLLGRLPGAFAFVLSTWIAVRFLDNRPFAALGLAFDKRWWSELGVGIGMGALAMGCIFVLQLLMGWLTFSGFGWERAWSVAYPLPLLGYLAGMLLVGFYEELMFRGYQITNMIEGFSYSKKSYTTVVFLAIAVSSILFGIMHAGNPNASAVSTVNIILAGIVLALPYLFTGSLALSCGIHAAWNFFQGGIFGFPVSGSPSRSSLLQVNETGPDLFTGGRFGPEAGLLGLIGLCLIVLMTYQYIRAEGYTLGLHDNFK